MAEQASGLPLDPMTMQAIAEQNLIRQTGDQGGSSATRMDNMAINQSVSSLFPSPAMQQAQQMQNALKAASAQVGTQAPGESDMDYSIRMLKAQRDAVMPFSPESASQLDTRILGLHQAAIEQAHLQASTKDLTDKDQEFQEQAPVRAAQNKLNALNANTAYVVTRTPNGDEPWNAQPFDLSTPEGTQAYLKAKSAPNTEGISPQAYQTLFSQGANADSSLMRALIAAQTKAAQANGDTIPDDTVQRATVDSIFNQTAASRLPNNLKTAIETYKQKVGLAPQDEFGARMELAAAQKAAGAVGSREGNIDILQRTIPGSGALVMSALQGVDRGSIQLINHAIANGATQFGSAGESRYAATIQTFVNEYGRLISGGTGRTTDSARKEAMDLLNKAQTPDQVKSVIDQLATKELGVLSGASSQAVQALANAKQYPHLMKVMDKLGYAPFDTAGDEAAQNTPIAPNANPAVTGRPIGTPPQSNVLTYDPTTGTFK